MLASRAAGLGSVLQIRADPQPEQREKKKKFLILYSVSFILGRFFIKIPRFPPQIHKGKYVGISYICSALKYKREKRLLISDVFASLFGNSHRGYYSF